MQAKISAKTVAKLKAGEIISDTEIRGFSARRWDTGAISYSLRYRTRNGDRKRFLIGTHGNVTPDEARKIAKQRAGEVAGGLDPVAEKKIAEAVASGTRAMAMTKSPLLKSISRERAICTPGRRLFHSCRP